jgi:hypothetical protein
MSFVGSEEDKLDVSYLKVDEASIIKNSVRVRVKVHLSHSSHF